MIPAADKARWHLFTRDEETAAPVTLLFRRWVQTVRRGPAREPDRARSLSEEPAAPDGAFHTPREAPSPRFSSGLFHGRRTSCHLIKWVPGACGLKQGGEGSGSTDFVPLEFPDAGAVEAERGNTRWDANGSGYGCTWR